MHIDTRPSSKPLEQFTHHFRREHLRPVNFWYQVHFLLFSFNQEPISAAAVIDVKNISNSKSYNQTDVFWMQEYKKKLLTKTN